MTRTSNHETAHEGGREPGGVPARDSARQSHGAASCALTGANTGATIGATINAPISATFGAQPGVQPGALPRTQPGIKPRVQPGAPADASASASTSASASPPTRDLADFKPDARFAWCVTGSGHMLEESIALARRLPRVDLFLSAAAEEVLPLYGWPLDKLREQFRVLRDNSASGVPVGMLYHGVYHTVVIAPATSNTVAKCAFGISDTLPTNMYAQAGKQCIPGIVFACDTEPTVITHSPDEWVELRPRAIELDNVERLSRFEYTTLVRSLDELEAALDQRLATLDLAWNTSSS